LPIEGPEHVIGPRDRPIHSAPISCATQARETAPDLPQNAGSRTSTGRISIIFAYNVQAEFFGPQRAQRRHAFKVGLIRHATRSHDRKNRLLHPGAAS
jgi:hypothetical protein